MKALKLIKALDKEVFIHRLFLCSIGIHKMQNCVNQVAKECYWGCGKKLYFTDIVNDKIIYK